jgi:hypothetical protein
VTARFSRRVPTPASAVASPTSMASWSASDLSGCKRRSGPS